MPFFIDLLNAVLNPLDPNHGACTDSAVYGPSTALVLRTWTPTHHTLPTHSMGITRSDEKLRTYFLLSVILDATCTTP